jgi:hypothetical protein
MRYLVSGVSSIKPDIKIDRPLKLAIGRLSLNQLFLGVLYSPRRESLLQAKSDRLITRGGIQQRRKQTTPRAPAQQSTEETEHNPRRVFVVGCDVEGGKRRLREIRCRASKSGREVEDDPETDQLQKHNNCKTKLISESVRSPSAKYNLKTAITPQLPVFKWRRFFLSNVLSESHGLVFPIVIEHSRVPHSAAFARGNKSSTSFCADRCNVFGLATVDLRGCLGLNCRQLIKSEALGLRSEARENHKLEMNEKPLIGCLGSHSARGSPSQLSSLLH